MISFRKTIANKLDFGKSRSSSTDSDEIEYGGGTENQQYADKLFEFNNISFERMKMIYVINPWIRSAVDKITDRASDIQPLIKPLSLNVEDMSDGKLPDGIKREIDSVGELIIRPNSDDLTFTQLRKTFSRDLLMYDASSIELVRQKEIIKDVKSAELYPVPGNTIKLKTNELGQLKKYLQVDRNLSIKASWNPGDLIYGKLNPQAGKIYGTSPIESLVETVAGDLYITKHNMDFWNNNATPRFAVLLENLGIGQAAPALKRFRTWWESELKGKPHSPIIIGSEGGQIKFQQVGLNNEEMQFQYYSIWLLMKICAVYKIPPQLMGIIMQNTSKSDYESLELQFKKEAIKPHLTLFAEKMNSQVIFNSNVLGLKKVYLDFDLDLEDKKAMAEVHEKYGRMGVLTINDIRTRGLGLLPVPWGNVPYLQNNLTPFGIGKNGAAVPVTSVSGDNNYGAVDDLSNIPNTAIASKALLKKYVSSDRGLPIGWENLEESDRLSIVEKMLVEKENYLSKVWMIPDRIKLNQGN